MKRNYKKEDKKTAEKYIRLNLKISKEYKNVLEDIRKDSNITKFIYNCFDKYKENPDLFKTSEHVKTVEELENISIKDIKNKKRTPEKTKFNLIKRYGYVVESVFEDIIFFEDSSIKSLKNYKFARCIDLDLFEFYKSTNKNIKEINMTIGDLLYMCESKSDKDFKSIEEDYLTFDIDLINKTKRDKKNSEWIKGDLIIIRTSEN